MLHLCYIVSTSFPFETGLLTLKLENFCFVHFIQENIPSISLNAGHDLNLKNLNYLLTKIPTIKEVSIGHALVCDAFEYGLKDTIQKYLTITNR